MARKVFISFLGKSDYAECKYGSPDTEKVKYVQEATLNYLGAKEWPGNSVAYILLTKDAKNANWKDDGHIDRTTKIIKKNIGLKKRLKLMKLPFKVKVIDKLPDGNTKKEIWKIFQRVFDKIEKGDELYFDLTHGFRYLPMLILVLGNYSKFLKDVKVKSITYGNFESRKNDVAPIIDITSLSLLQDWTYAAGTYLDSGNVKKLTEMSGERYADFADKLKETIADFHTCRGISIIESTNIKQIKSLMDSMDTSELPPLKYVFDEIKADFNKYDDIQNVKNGYESAKWCYKNQLYQQAITILIETVISDICISENLDWKRRKNREIASNALYIVANSISENGWKVVTDTDDKDKYKADYLPMLDSNPESLDVIEENVKYRKKYYTELMLYRQLVESQRVKELIELSSMIKDVRDDIDHAGMRDGARPYDVIESELKNIFTKLNSIALCS